MAGAAADSIDEALLERALGELLRRYDKGGEQFYDTISALHKSVRGSDPDAALYWLVRMLDGGVDPRYVARRVIRMASEDIGLADPRALRLALDAAEVYERLGSPEGELALAQAVVYLARGAEVERGLQGLERGARLRARGRHAAGAAAPAQCADQADEAARLRQRLPLRARRGRAASPPARPTCPRAWRAQRFYEPVDRGPGAAHRRAAGRVARAERRGRRR